MNSLVEKLKIAVCRGTDGLGDEDGPTGLEDEIGVADRVNEPSDRATETPAVAENLR